MNLWLTNWSRKAQVGQRHNLALFFSIDAQSLTSALLGPSSSTSVRNIRRVSRVWLFVCLNCAARTHRPLLFLKTTWKSIKGKMEVSFTVLHVTGKPDVLPSEIMTSAVAGRGCPAKSLPAHEQPSLCRDTLTCFAVRRGKRPCSVWEPPQHVSHCPQQRGSLEIFVHSIRWYITLFLKFSFNFNFNSIYFLKFT